MAGATPDKFGPYKVLSSLGSGGMGDVWRARDTRLDRVVALKTSRSTFDDRFEREARAVASLNHPNIVALYDVGREDGVSYLVTELVEGETLRAVLLRDPMPLRRALELGAQIAEGLAAAHQIGIVHRDLKPENIMVTREGRAKILDFGLAKRDEQPKSDETQTHSGPLTNEGSVMGTVGYMSPEQARGRVADTRSDIFSFGVVLYEMLGGKRAFDAETTPETLTAILKSDPAELPASIPTAVRNCVFHCMEKEPGSRFQSAKDLAFALHALAGNSSSASGATAAVVGEKKRPVWKWVAMAAMLVAGVLGGLWELARSAPSATEQLRFLSFLADPEAELAPSFSPDGQSIAYWRMRPGGRALYLKALDNPEPVQLTLDAGRFAGPQTAAPFWSVDSARIFYTGDRKLWAIGAAGGSPQVMLEDVDTAILSADGQHLVVAKRSDAGYEIGLSSPPGSAVKRLGYDLSVLGTSQIQLLAFAPDGKRIALRARTELWLLPYPSGELKRVEQLDQVGSVSWFPDGRHMLVTGSWKGTVSRLLELDADSREVLALDQGTQGVASAQLAPNGFRAISAVGSAARDIVEIGADGKFLGERLASSLPESAPSWSPSGDRFAYVVALGEGSQVRLTAGGMDQSIILATGLRGSPQPQFSPDGKRVAYAEPRQIWVRPAAGGRPVGLLAKDYPNAVLSVSWSPTGDWIAFAEGVNGRARLRKVSASGGAVPVEVKSGPVGRPMVSWSADGKWLAYPGMDGIHVVSPDGGEDRLVTKGGAMALQFGRKGEVLYTLGRTDDERTVLTSLDVVTGREIRTVTAELDAKTTPRSFSPSPDGGRFLIEVLRPNSDLWLIEGIPQPSRGLARLWTRWLPPPPARMPGEGELGPPGPP